MRANVSQRVDSLPIAGMMRSSNERREVEPNPQCPLCGEPVSGGHTLDCHKRPVHFRCRSLYRLESSGALGKVYDLWLRTDSDGDLDAQAFLDAVSELLDV